MGKTTTFTLMIFLFITLIGCAVQREVAPAPKIEEPVIAQPVSPKAEWQQEWEKTLKAAQKEGRVSVWSTSGGETKDAIVRAFKDKYNIDVDWIVGRPFELQAKIQNERNAGIYTADIIMVGVSTSLWMRDHGFLVPMDKLLILSEVKDPKNWYQNRFPWIDEKDYTSIGFATIIVNYIAINTSLIKAEEIKDVNDILHPKWKGKISLSDPSVGGVGTKSFGMIGEFIIGWDYFRELVKNEPMITRDTRLQVEWLARGKYPVALAARSESINEFKKAGAPVTYHPVKNGSYLSMGGSTLAILNKAPHPDATVIYVNWFLSREGQTIFSRVRGVESLRLDVPNDHLQFVRDPKIEYLRADTPEVLAKEGDWPAKARELFGALIQ